MPYPDALPVVLQSLGCTGRESKPHVLDLYPGGECTMSCTDVAAAIVGVYLIRPALPGVYTCVQS